jgi:U2 small nuclear ribonucleoprotein A'
MRLTAEVVKSAPQYMSQIKQRELSLRALKAAVIENLGVTEDEFDAIDLSENEFLRLDNLPLLPRLKTLLLSGNRISRVADNIGESCQNLQYVNLANNRVPTVDAVAALQHCPHLYWLSLQGNPITQTEHYRLHVIHRLPQLRVLDCKKVSDLERKACIAVLGKRKAMTAMTTSGVDAADDDAEEEAGEVVGQGGNGTAQAPAAKRQKVQQQQRKFSKEEKADLIRQIQASTSLEEIGRLENMLMQNV